MSQPSGHNFAQYGENSHSTVTFSGNEQTFVAKHIQYCLDVDKTPTSVLATLQWRHEKTVLAVHCGCRETLDVLLVGKTHSVGLSGTDSIDSLSSGPKTYPKRYLKSALLHWETSLLLRELAHDGL